MHIWFQSLSGTCVLYNKNVRIMSGPIGLYCAAERFIEIAVDNGCVKLSHYSNSYRPMSESSAEIARTGSEYNRAVGLPLAISG